MKQTTNMPDCLDSVVYYGAFKEALDKIVDIMRSEYAGSIIIRGNPGSGKKTLIREAQTITGVRYVSISSHFYIEDFNAMKFIATQLGFKSRALHISDIMDEIRESAASNEKLVIVLQDFEEFCRKRQSLLYNLTNLIHTDPNQDDKGLNLTLVGLTASLDWAENIEKRVRSRLNAKCIDLTYPYRNGDQFLEFASQLLNGYSIKGEFKEHLQYIYQFSNRSIRTLKKYLYNICSTDSKGRLKVEFDPDAWCVDYQFVRNNLLRERLRYLTRPQLDMMKAAVAYCALFKTNSFTLGQLNKYVLDRSYKTIDVTSNHAQKDAAILVLLKLFKPAKSDQAVSDEAVFFPAATAIQFRAVIEGDRSLHHTSTDILWTSLRVR